MIYPLSKNKKTNFLSASSGYYTEEYAQRMFNHYLQTELISDEYGNVKKYYRLYAKEDHPRIWHWLITCSVLIAKVH